MRSSIGLAVGEKAVIVVNDLVRFVAHVASRPVPRSLFHRFGLTSCAIHFPPSVLLRGYCKDTRGSECIEAQSVARQPTNVPDLA